MGLSVRSAYLEIKQDCATSEMVLPPGKYVATLRQEVCILPSGAAEWQPIHYAIDLRQPRLREIGGAPWQDRNSLELDVTDCVTAGLIEVEGPPGRPADRRGEARREVDGVGEEG